MITFFFKVGKSFLKYSNHPITIPREHYKCLEREIYSGSGKRTIFVRISPPKGRLLDGEIYYGVASYGPYYQIKVLGAYPSDYFGDLQIGEILGVTIQDSEGEVKIKIVSTPQLQEFIKKLENTVIIKRKGGNNV